MSIESGSAGGGIGGPIGGGGIAAGGIGPAGGIGAVGGIEKGGFSAHGIGIGPEITTFSSIVNEGPVRGSLEGFRPMGLSDINTIDTGGVIAPLGEIVFNSQPLTVEVAVSQAEAILSEARINSNAVAPQAESLSEGSVVAEARHWLGISESKPVLAEPQAQALWEILPDAIQVGRTRTGLKEAGFPDLAQKVDNYLQPEVIRVARQIVSPSVAQQVIEEVAEEEIEEEGVEELKLKYVEHEEVSRQRKYEIREAIKEARTDAEKEGVEEIEGWRIKKYFAPEHKGIRSGIAEPGVPDGSLEETYQDISARNYDSEAQASEVTDATIADKKPVKKAKEGNKVREIDIARVRRGSFIKRYPTEEVVARIVKKRILAEKAGQEFAIHEVKPEVLEPTIEDLDLAEVFQRAA